jgi:uncharacterized membrane protein (UPF0136 family)
MSALAVGVLLGYGVILIAGGFAGWRLSGSRISLTASLASAALLAIAYRLALFHLLAGYLLAVLVSLGLAIMFGRRFRRTKKVMPAGMMLAVSAMVFAILGWLTASSL